MRAALALLLGLGLESAGQDIPKTPDALAFEPIAFEPPRARDHRVVLRNGLVAYVKEDRTLPLVNVAVQVRAGRWLEPPGQEGLAALVGSQMRRGGAGSLSAEALDERLDFLAAQVGTGVGDTSASASLNCLKDNLDEALRLFVQVLRAPRFQEDRLALAKEQALQEMRKRNDESADIEAREWNVLLLGEGHFTNRFSTEASLRAVTRDDLVAFHRRYFYPANMILAVSGAFSRGEIVRKLEAAFAGWPSPRLAVPPVPSEIRPAAPGLFRIQKDVNQGRVSIGLPGVLRTSPDIYALEVMNEILGGSGFTSRITRSVRSNEGLAYSAGSGIGFGVYYPGRFRAGLQSKSRSVALATRLVIDEIRRIREELVTDEELETIKRSLIETFPSSFASAAQVVGTFAGDEYTKRDPGFWQTYRERIRAVTRDDVRRVARAHLVPERMMVLVVGDQKEIDLGDPKHPVALDSLAPLGRVVTLPLRDPMTMTASTSSGTPPRSP
ncbi:MAG TPA: pitrilysin family protein [Vicinamibacteria bacterium]|nr:pitrilysin family protein [Vicinamibacteria bacterium]